MANGGQPLGIPGKGPRASNVMELSPTGTVIGTYIAGSIPIGIAIDKSGNDRKWGSWDGACFIERENLLEY